MAAKRGPYAKTDRRRQLLSQAALDLVQEKGHRNVSVSEIAARADTSEPTVFYHFPSKESLLIAALKRHDDMYIRAQGEEAGAIAEMGSRADLGVQRTRISRLYAEMAGAAVDPEHPAHSYFRERWARSIAVVAADIRRLQANADVPRDVDADTAARVLLAAWEGLQFQWQHGPEFDIRSVIEWHITSLLGPGALAEAD